MPLFRLQYRELPSNWASCDTQTDTREHGPVVREIRIRSDEKAAAPCASFLRPHVSLRQSLRFFLPTCLHWSIPSGRPATTTNRVYRVNEALAVGWRKRRAVDEKEAIGRQQLERSTRGVPLYRPKLLEHTTSNRWLIAWCLPASYACLLALDFMSGFAERPALSENPNRLRSL